MQFRHTATFACSSLCVALLFTFAHAAFAEDKSDSAAKMKPYTQEIPGGDVSFDLIPIPGGEFLLGSPAGEAERKDDEGPQVKVRIEPFWMGKHEVSWDEYDVWSFNLDIQRRKLAGFKPTPLDKTADVVTRPTKPYTDMTFGMGHNGYPAICMTQLAAKMYCRWLSAKTGHFYRLPTEAEWEYAARGGSSDTFFFGSDQDQLCKYANVMDYYGGRYFPMFAASAIDCDDDYVRPAPVGKFRPNSLGIHDMLGNVSEWTQDCWSPTYSAVPTDGSALVIAECDYHVARGGSWMVTPKNMGDRTRAYRGTETLGFRVARTLP